MKYGYARVSTTHQDLEAQLQAFEKENCDNNLHRTNSLEQKQIGHSLMSC